MSHSQRGVWLAVALAAEDKFNMSDEDDNRGSELRDLRWWWLGPATRSWSAAEINALLMIAGFFLVIAVTLGVWLEKVEMLFLHTRVLWIEIVGGLGAAVLAAYLSTSICRFLWPSLITEAQTNYSKTMGVIHRTRRERNRL